MLMATRLRWMDGGPRLGIRSGAHRSPIVAVPTKSWMMAQAIPPLPMGAMTKPVLAKPGAAAISAVPWMMGLVLFGLHRRTS